ncbi:ubiquitin-specific protease otu1 [Linnemannia schmuckeri]|uniref:Ubiquitin thioesterase OTU n=1 Tax=Linnemannia schmuckeri TaxID=64567 RepID=A0A9P5V6W6_9FUNG|nr:ubiquitin-specific protease otu1 [Linnemannia schmuckeri]
MRLRIRHKEGIATLTTLTDQSTLLDLHSAIASEIKAPVARLELKFGYPPKLLVIDDSTAGATLASLGVKDGEQILTSEKPEGSPATYAFTSTGGSSAPTTTTATSTRAPAHTATTTTAAATPATSAFGANSSGNSFGAFGSRSVLHASQPQQTTASSFSPSAFQAAAARPTTNAFGGLSTVDTSYKPKAETAPVPAPTASTAAPKGGIESVRIRDQGLLVLREVEDDNSCLFNAIAYTLDPSMKSNVQGLRQIVAKAIDANPDAYPDVVLGRPRKEYCDWIRKENSWGGAIELAIFSDYYKIEIDSIDVSTNRVDRFGEGQYDQRALVMYSGIHYDAVALTPSLDIPAECDQTQFETTSEDILTAGIQLAAKLKQAHKYTDLATFTLRCSICQIGLKGEKDAQQHAQSTMHTSL